MIIKIIMTNKYIKHTQNAKLLISLKPRFRGSNSKITSEDEIDEMKKCIADQINNLKQVTI